ncbi:FdhF/YdeP family oxidoreductase [Actinospica durhamensis]|uniref:FdhF/YdeP family oxidoreductase n=1 Tax=Actinospica durhamensis TaxID=1508375 RepID=A0A941IMJ1_9ACTN|nr:FdhF/YdeP family oxidoreductase [Actinospica durhamensis]MBR7832919.1 FdhF/YdeP family oxidoreductase [Actinospica durhamensis]
MDPTETEGRPGDDLGRGAPGVAARGRGPNRPGDISQEDDEAPSAGWGAARSVTRVVAKTHEPVRGPLSILKMNHENGGFDCPGCAWPDDIKGLHLDICENGIKHVTWEMTPKKTNREFFAAHTVTELSGWPDYALEKQGRLSEPMVYDETSDKYVPISWPDAFALVGRTLRGLEHPDQAAFYTSGRLNNEATFLYQLWAREFGTNNLPDCSNMCHEATGRALQASLGTGKGTCDIRDWDAADLLIIMGVNAASNAPRMLTTLAKAQRRGAQIVHVNPLIEAAARRTIVPHEFAAMATFHATSTGTMSVQVGVGGDLALLRGVAKAVLERAERDPAVLDAEFIERHTSGFESYRDLVRATDWAELVRQSGVAEERIRELAERYLAAGRTVVSWCLGVTQQDHGVDTVREIVNLLMLRGNLGREGAGPSPVRGHSNVQGNRTCGIDHRPAPGFLDALDEVCGIRSPREHGLDTVAVIKAMREGRVKVFVAMGGNFVLAAPDTDVTTAALRGTELTVQTSTKLNRSHLVHGRAALILPCLGRTERDVQASGEQGVSVEDAMSEVHISVGMRNAKSPDLKSECAIVAGMARATLPESKTPWEWYVEDYDRIRDTMARVLPGFEDFNRRVREPLGFRITQPARVREFHTESGRAEFCSSELPDVTPPEGMLVLSTMRSHDQWNTTVYSDNDRYRGVKNLRTLLLMNRMDMDARGLAEFALIDITSHARDGSTRSVHGYRVIEYDIPPGSVAGYMPELNILCGLDDYSRQSDQPLMKHQLVTVTTSQAAPERTP